MVSSRAIAVSIGVLASLAFGATGAQAAQRYASTTGGGSLCTTGIPCDIVTAFNLANPGDEVIVNPGTYTITDGLYAPSGGSAHGIAGQPKPLINSSASNALNQNGAALVSDLRINHVGAGTGFVVAGATSIAEHIDVVTTGTRACDVTVGALLRDSFCINNKAAGVGDRVALDSSWGTGGANTAHVRNVTAIGTGAGSYGVHLLALGATTTTTLDMRNVIASGVQADVQAQSSVSGTATANLAYSNFDSSSVTPTGATVTSFATANNQSTPPIFVNAGAGDYHQAAGSPTINAGSPDDKIGTLDIDNEARSQGTAIDIGADEFTEIPPDTTPPDTTISKGPKERTKSTKAKFTFSADEVGSTFECKLDKGAYEDCTSPQKYKKLKKGKHTFSVRGTDAAANVDATPATYRWTVKKKRKGH